MARPKPIEFSVTAARVEILPNSIRQDPRRRVGEDRVDAKLELTARNVYRAGDVPRRVLPIFTRVDEQRGVGVVELFDRLERDLDGTPEVLDHGNGVRGRRHRGQGVVRHVSGGCSIGLDRLDLVA